MSIEKNLINLSNHDLQNSNQSLSLFSIQKVQIDKECSISCLYDEKILLILDVRSQNSDFDKLQICSIIFTHAYVLLLLQHQMDKKNTLRKCHIFICTYRHGIMSHSQ